MGRADPPTGGHLMPPLYSLKGCLFVGCGKVELRAVERVTFLRFLFGMHPY